MILKAKYIWDGISQKSLEQGAVLIEGGLIRAVGRSDEMRITSGAHVVEFPDATLMPGLIDSHTHLSMDGAMPDYLDHMTDSVPVLTQRAISMMQKDLLSGVTTCRCLGDREFLDVACRQRVETGELTGPSLLVATRGIRSPDGHGFVGYPFKGIDAIRTAIKENINRGADLIKIYITGTLKGNGNLPAYLSFDEIKAAIDEAHRAGKRVASHCVGGPGLDWALELGLDTLEHAYQITEDQTERLMKSKTALVLTPGAVLSEERIRKLPARLIDGHLKERDQMFASMAMTVRSQIPFAVGTDGMHGDLPEDILYLSSLGASNHQALLAATAHGAKVCGIEKETGTIKTGMRADLIAVQGNPLHDLDALRRVVAVVKLGIVVHNISQTKLRDKTDVSPVG